MPPYKRYQLLAMFNTPETKGNGPRFRQLWEAVKLHIRNEPDDSIGLAGPRKGKQLYTLWVQGYLDSGIGQRYWGPETPGHWRIDRDRASIVEFFEKLIGAVVLIERAARAARAKRRHALRMEKGENENGEGEEEEEEEEEGEEEEEEEENEEGGEDESEEPHSPQHKIPPKVPATLASASGRSPGRTPKKRRRLSGSIPQDIATTILPENTSGPTPPQESNDDRTFETRLGDDETIAFLFAPYTISFQQFIRRFCEAWKIDPLEMKYEDVRVKVYIAGAGEYHLSFGPDRRKSWLYIMKMTEGRPGFHILVTLGN